MRLALFTDTLGDINGVCRFIQNLASRANATGRDLRVFTSTNRACPEWPNIRNFRPIAARAMPGYANLDIVWPPPGRMLRELDRDPPDVIHVSTPGPVGIAGLIAARRFGRPVLGVYHTDFPAYVERLFDDRALAWITARAMARFYGRMARVFTRSDDYRSAVIRLGVEPARLRTLVPGVDTETFHPRHADPGIWARLTPESNPSVRVLYVGRLSVEKNLAFLARVWVRARERMRGLGIDAELIVVGDGPHRGAIERELEGRGTRFLGFRHGAELSAIYASSDLFVFPSTTDTLGQVVMESQASGLPVLVTDQGGPKEVVREGRTGHILGGSDIAAWVEAISRLCGDADGRRAMGRRAHEAMQGLSIAGCFESFWAEHEAVWREGRGRMQ